MEPAAETVDQIRPAVNRNLQPLQDWSQVGGDRASFVVKQLAASPVEQLQVLIQAERQEATVRSSPLRR